MRMVQRLLFVMVVWLRALQPNIVTCNRLALAVDVDDAILLHFWEKLRQYSHRVVLLVECAHELLVVDVELVIELLMSIVGL